MAGVRDPAFWKRFSMAVHLDEQTPAELKHTDSWLERQQRKTAKRKWTCPLFWLTFFCFVAAVIAIVIWLLKSGVLSGVHIGEAAPQGAQGGNSTVNGTTTRRELESRLRLDW